MKTENMEIEVAVNTKKAMKAIRELKLEINRLQHPAHGVDWRFVGELIIAGLMFVAGYVLFKSF